MKNIGGFNKLGVDELSHRGDDSTFNKIGDIISWDLIGS